MDKIHFDYSMKNIPLPSNDANKKTLLTKIESFIKHMLWKAQFFLHPLTESSKTAQNYNLKSTKSPLQRKLPNDIKKINSSSNVLVFADKSRNVYEVDKEQHEKLLRENTDHKKLQEN